MQSPSTWPAPGAGSRTPRVPFPSESELEPSPSSRFFTPFRGRPLGFLLKTSHPEVSRSLEAAARVVEAARPWSPRTLAPEAPSLSFPLSPVWRVKMGSRVHCQVLPLGSLTELEVSQVPQSAGTASTP